MRIKFPHQGCYRITIRPLRDIAKEFDFQNIMVDCDECGQVFEVSAKDQNLYGSYSYTKYWRNRRYQRKMRKQFKARMKELNDHT